MCTYRSAVSAKQTVITEDKSLLMENAIIYLCLGACTHCINGPFTRANGVSRKIIQIFLVSTLLAIYDDLAHVLLTSLAGN